MRIVRLLKYSVLAGCVACFVATVVLGLWPLGPGKTRIFLYVAQAGAWCIFAAICYVLFRFVRAGLQRSKRW